MFKKISILLLIFTLLFSMGILPSTFSNTANAQAENEPIIIEERSSPSKPNLKHTGGSGIGGGSTSSPTYMKNGSSNSQVRTFWTRVVNFRGIKVYQAPRQFESTNANIARMRQGKAPIGTDGKPVNLHHMTQRNDSSIAELTQTFHQQNSQIIHVNPRTIPSGINRAQFDKWRQDYWKWRADNP